MSEITLPDRPLTWVFAGDSITQGVLHTYGRRCWVEHVAERVHTQLDRTTDILINSGMSGWTSAWVLREFDWLIGRFAPDVLSIALGTNDASVDPERHAGPDEVAAAIVEIGRRADAWLTIVHTPPPIAAEAYDRRPDFDAYAPAIRGAAAELGAVLVDHAAYWPRRFGEDSPLPWLDDVLHPNATGQLAMADLTLAALGLGAVERVGGPAAIPSDSWAR